MQTFDSFPEARSAADDQGLAVGGFYAGDEPRYFLHEPAATDPEVRALAFEATHGRPMNVSELQLTRLQDEVAPVAVRPKDPDAAD